jgi:Ni/Co efflux regulator RcnB
MKILTLVAAAAAAILAVPAASAAPAAPGVVSVASFAASAPAAQSRSWERERRYERRTNKHRRAYYRNTCTRKWRNGHRVRVCRKVRYYR